MDTNIFYYCSLRFEPALRFYFEQISDFDNIFLVNGILKAEVNTLLKDERSKTFRDKTRLYFGMAKHINESIDDEILDLAADVRHTWGKKAGKKLPLADAIIGATAVVHDATLYSVNDKDFTYFVDEYNLKYTNPFKSYKNEFTEFLKEKRIITPEKRAAEHFRKITENIHSDVVTDLFMEYLEEMPVKLIRQMSYDLTKD